MAQNYIRNTTCAFGVGLHHSKVFVSASDGFV